LLTKQNEDGQNALKAIYENRQYQYHLMKGYFLW